MQKNKIMKIKNVLFYALVIISTNLFSQINNITNINDNTINTNTLIQDIIDLESNKDLLSTQSSSPQEMARSLLLIH